MRCDGVIYPTGLTFTYTPETAPRPPTDGQAILHQKELWWSKCSQLISAHENFFSQSRQACLWRYKSKRVHSYYIIWSKVRGFMGWANYKIWLRARSLVGSVYHKMGVAAIFQNHPHASDLLWRGMASLRYMQFVFYTFFLTITYNQWRHIHQVILA